MALHSFGGVGDILTQPQLPSRGAAAPQEQLGLWQKFQQKLQTDPNFRLALMTTGLNMLRTPEIGQSGFDVFADAATQGIGTLEHMRQRETTEQTRIAERAEDVGDRRRRIGIAEEGVEVDREQLAATTSFNAERIRVMDETNRIRDKAADAAKIKGIGVQQVLINAVAKNLKTAFPNRYQGEVGEAQAFLDAQVRSQQVTDPDQYRSQLLELVKLMTFDEGYGDLPLQEKLVIAQKILPQGGVGLGAAETPADPLDGKSFSHPEFGQGTIRKKGANTYVIEYADGGVSGEVTREAIEGFLSGNP